MKRGTILAFSSLLVLPGCALAPLPVLMAANVGMYGLGAARVIRTFGSGELEIKPFENTYTAFDRIQELKSAKVIAIAPSKGLGAEFTDELINVFSVNGTQVLSPNKFMTQSNATTLVDPTDNDEIEFAKEAGKKAGAEFVVFSKVKADGQIGGSWSQFLIGGKSKEPYRLVLRVVSVKDGVVVYKDELPYVVLLGSSMPSEKEVIGAVAPIVKERINNLWLQS